MQISRFLVSLQETVHDITLIEPLSSQRTAYKLLQGGGLWNEPA